MAITNISSVHVGDVVKCVDLKGITFPSITEGNLYTVVSVSTSKNLIGVRSDVGEAVYYYAARRFDKEATIAKGGTYIELDLNDYPEVQSMVDLEVVLGDFEAAIIKHVHKNKDGSNLLVFKTSYLSNFDTLADAYDYVFDGIPKLNPKWGHKGNGFLKFGSLSSGFSCWWIDKPGDGTTKDAKELFSSLNLVPMEIKKDTMKWTIINLESFPSVKDTKDLEELLKGFDGAVVHNACENPYKRNDTLFLLSNKFLKKQTGSVVFGLWNVDEDWGHEGVNRGICKKYPLENFRGFWTNYAVVELTDEMKHLFGVDSTSFPLIPVNNTSTPAPDVEVDIASLHGEEFEKALFAAGEQAVIVDFGKAVTGINETAVVLIAHELLDKAEELGVEAYVMGEVIQATWGFDEPYVLEKTGILKGHCGKSETLGVCRGKSIKPDAIETAHEELDNFLKSVEEAEKRKAKEEAEKVLEELPKPIIHRFYS